MDTQLDYILKQGKILNELELERALVIDRKLRLLLKEHPELSQKRKELRTIIKNYEDFKWNSKSKKAMPPNTMLNRNADLSKREKKQLKPSS